MNLKEITRLFFALRPAQWVKNLCVFLPLIFGGKLFIYPENAKAAAAFFIFSLAAGSAYLLNDVIDAERDKQHPVKCFRPIAAGKLKKKHAISAAIFFGSLSLIFSFWINILFGVLVLVYLAYNLLYSKVLKNMVIIDTFCLAGFFIIRILAGGIVAQVELSHWIIIMTALLALFLGFNKRRQEIQMLQGGAPAHREVLKKYNAYFIDQMAAVSSASIVIAYLLYAVDTRTILEFGSTNLLWSVPFVYYGIFRYLYLVHQLGREGDPAQMLLTDRALQINILLWVLVCLAVVYGK